MIVKIQKHNGIGITTLVNNDVESLSYTKVLNGVGSMEFTVRVDNSKINATSIRTYNRVVLEDDGVKFSGFISETNINLETITVRCLGLMAILKVRIAPLAYNLSGSVNSVVEQLIDKANQDENTGIIKGDLAGAGTISRELNGDTIYDAIDDCVSGTGNQWRFNHNDGTVDIKPLIGFNLQDKIVLRYDTRIIQLSNIAGFQVSDKGDSVTTVAYGRTDSTNDSVEDATLIDKYGRIEKNKAYRTISNADLESQLYSELSESEYSPELVLLPSVPDTFDVGDILGVKLYNKVIDIDTAYQVLEKEVSYSGDSKIIKIKINKKQTDILDIIKKHEKDIRSLSNHL